MSTSPRVALHRSPPDGGGNDAACAADADDGGVSGWSQLPPTPPPSPNTPDETRFNSCTVVGSRVAKDPLRLCPPGVPFAPPRHAFGRRSLVAIATHALHSSALSISPGVDASSPSLDDDGSTMSALFPTKSAGTGSPQKPCTTQPSRASPRSLPPTAATMASRASVSEPAGVWDANEADAAISLAQRANRPSVRLRVRSCTNTTPSRSA